MSRFQYPGPNPPVLPQDIQIMSPPSNLVDKTISNRACGSLIGLAIGDAIGAGVESQPRQNLAQHPVNDMIGGGKWSLQPGQWTDETSMALCLSASLINKRGFSPYDQMVRYKWWFCHGYLSSKGKCFGIGKTTRAALEEFHRRQEQAKKQYNVKPDVNIDSISSDVLKRINFDPFCGQQNENDNDALTRLAPVAIYFYKTPTRAVHEAGQSARLTHGNEVTIDACRYFAALIVAALQGEKKEDILDSHFYEKHQYWFGSKPLHSSVQRIASRSSKRRRAQDETFRSDKNVLHSLEAALWAFANGQSFSDCVLKAVNLGDASDATGAICGQLAGAHYGYDNIPQQWKQKIYAHKLIFGTAQWLQVMNSFPQSYRRPAPPVPNAAGRFLPNRSYNPNQLRRGMPLNMSGYVNVFQNAQLPPQPAVNPIVVQPAIPLIRSPMVLRQQMSLPSGAYVNAIQSVRL